MRLGLKSTMKFGTTKLNKDKAMKKIVALTIGLFVVAAGSAFAKLPAPSPEQAAAAELAKAKTAYAGKVGAYQLCMVENTIANRFKAAGTPAPAACVQPPAFVPPTVQAAAPAAPPAAAAPAAPKQ